MKIFNLLILLSIIQHFVKSAEEVKQIDVWEKLNNIEIKEVPGYAFFKLSMSPSYEKKKDLIIKVIPLDYDSDPDIYISKVHEKPRSPFESEWQCSYYGKDSCVVHHLNITKQDTFNIGVVCALKPCKFSLISIFTDEHELENGVGYQTDMFKQDAKMFKFYIPPMNGKNSSVTIKASSYRGNAHDFSLSVEIPRESNYEEVIKRGIPAWKNGQVIRLTPQDPYYWCSDCNITIMLDVEDQGYYHIQAQTNEAAPLLQNGVQVDDVINYGDTQCYKYYVKKEDTDFQIILNTYNGRVDVHAHPNQIPESWDKFAIQREADYDQIIDIRPWIRKHIANQEKGLYYVCVQGILTSTYTLKIHEFEQEQGHTILQDGYSEMFFLRPDSMQIHMYQVPQLEYTDEDILIEVNLILFRGVQPKLAAIMCQQGSLEGCRKSITKEDVINKKMNFTYGNDNGQMLQLVIDHDEEKCQTLYNGDCNYAIVVISQNSEYSSYQITVSHTQNNHILLQEGKVLVDSVNIKRQKYYKFTVIDDKDVRNVTFELTPLHGDSDLFISRTLLFPNKTDFEKRSVRIGSLPDHVEYSKLDQGSLATTYYISVFGYSYASYSIIANIVRANNNENSKKSILSQLYEGIPFSKTLHNELDAFVTYFEVSIPDNQEDQNIQISIQNTKGKTWSYVKFGEIGGPPKHDFKIMDGLLTIKPNDPAYHKKGTYYILTMPKFGLFNLFTDDYYSYTITWKLENTVTYITEHTPLNIKTQPQKYSYVKHLISQIDQNIRISLINGGQQDIYVSVNNSNKKPTSQQFDMTSKFSKGGNYTQGKSMIIPYSDLKHINKACIDLGYAENEQCILYIGIYCYENKACESQLTLQYEDNKPKKLVIGQQKHSSININNYSYFFHTIAKNQITDFYAVLTPLFGDLDLFVQLVRDYKDLSEVDLPTVNNYFKSSKEKLGTEMIHLTKDDLAQCFTSNATDNDECIIIYGIYAIPDQPEQTYQYNFIVYTNVIEVKSNIPNTGYVNDGQFAYFLYKEDCQNCTIIISLSSYTQGDPDLYITKGESVPTLTDYHIKKATLHSEVVTLNLDTDYFVQNNIDSMEGYYLIGVYGNKNTTFTLSITSQQTPITNLVEGLALKNRQSTFDITYYQFYNWQESDIEISLEVSTGQVDLYVNTFDPSSNQQNFVDKLPESKRDTKGWIIEDINTQNSLNRGKELVILTSDRKYCVDCTYLIAVVTHDMSASYNIIVKSIDAEQTYSHLLKIGQVKPLTFNSNGEEQIFQFMLENYEVAMVEAYVTIGKVKVYVSFDENKQNAFIDKDNGGPIIIEGKQLKTEVNYYVIVESLSDRAEMTLHVRQKKSIIQLKDGLPQSIRFKDDQDVSKNMIFDLQEGNFTLIINLKSKTKNFFPDLYIKTYKENDVATTQASEVPTYSQHNRIKDWDKDMYLLKHTIQFTNQPSHSILAIHLIYKPNEDEQIKNAEVIVTVSQSRIIRLVQNEEYFGELKQGSKNFGLFRVEPPQGKNLLIEFSECLGYTQFSVITQPNDTQSIQQTNKVTEHGKTRAYYDKLQGQVSYILVEPIYQFTPFVDTEYLLKIQYVNNMDIVQQTKYLAHNGGHIDIQFVKGRKREVKLTWGPLYQFTTLSTNQQVEGVRYQLVKSKEPNARLDSVCAIKRDSRNFEKVGDIKGEKKEITLSNIEPGKEIFFNVIAIKDDIQLTYPYQPVSFYFPARSSYGGRWLIYLLVTLFFVFLVLATFFFVKSRRLQKRLQYEVTEVETMEGGIEKYRRVIGSSQHNTNNRDFNVLPEEIDQQ